jgi:hypothetical protein
MLAHLCKAIQSRFDALFKSSRFYICLGLLRFSLSLRFRRLKFFLFFHLLWRVFNTLRLLSLLRVGLDVLNLCFAISFNFFWRLLSLIYWRRWRNLFFALYIRSCKIYSLFRFCRFFNRRRGMSFFGLVWRLGSTISRREDNGFSFN